MALAELIFIQLVEAVIVDIRSAHPQFVNQKIKFQGESFRDLEARQGQLSQPQDTGAPLTENLRGSLIGNNDGCTLAARMIAVSRKIFVSTARHNVAMCKLWSLNGRSDSYDSAS